MIATIIHQTAKTADIPERWRAYQRRIRDLYPGWEYRLWTDEDNLALVRERMPEFEGAFLSAPLNIMRADLIRYIILDTFGGLYLDLDYEFQRHYEFDGYRLVLPRESDDDQPVFVGNAVMASEPGHPLWRALIREYLARLPEAPRYPEEEDVITLTGPALVTRVYLREFAADPSIFVPPHYAFHPPMPWTDDEYKALQADERVYGIHHCDGTWRALTYPQKIARRLRRLVHRMTR